MRTPVLPEYHQPLEQKPVRGLENKVGRFCNGPYKQKTVGIDISIYYFLSIIRIVTTQCEDG